MLSRLHQFWSRIEDLCAYGAAILIALAMALTVAEVISRRLFNAPLPGVIDMFDLGMGAIAFLGASQCQRAGGHVRMELLVRTLSGRPLWLVETFTTLLTLGFITAIGLSSAEAVVRAYRVQDATMDMLLTIWPSKALITLALGVLAVRLALQFIDSLRLVITPSARPVMALTVASLAGQAKEEIEEALGEDQGNRP